MSDIRRKKLPGRFSERVITKWNIIQFNMDNELSDPVAEEDIIDESGQTTFNVGDNCSAVWNDGISYEGKVVFQSDEKEKCRKYKTEQQKKSKKSKPKRKSNNNNEAIDPLSKKKKEANLEKKKAEIEKQETAVKNAKEMFKNCMQENTSVCTNNSIVDFNSCKPINTVPCTASVPNPAVGMHVTSSGVMPNTHVPSSELLPHTYVPPPGVVPNMHTAPSGYYSNTHVPPSGMVPYTQILSSSVVPNTHIPYSGLMSNMQLPYSGMMPSMQISSSVEVPNTHVPSSVEVSNTHVPSSVEVSNTHVSSSGVVPNTHIPYSGMMPNMQLPYSGMMPNLQLPSSVEVSNTHVPSSVEVSNTHVPSSGVMSYKHVPSSTPMSNTVNHQQHLNTSYYPSQPVPVSNPSSNTAVSSDCQPLSSDYTTSSNPLTEFTQLTSFQPINNCADCTEKENQNQSLQLYVDKLESDLTFWREEATKLKTQIDSRSDSLLENQNELGRMSVFNSTGYYMPARGIRVHKCHYKIPDQQDTNIPEGYLRLVEGHQLLVPVPWMNDIQGAYKGKTKTCAVKLMLNGFYQPKDVQEVTGRELSETYIGSTLKAFAMKTWGLSSNAVIAAFNSKIGTMTRAHNKTATQL